MKLRGSPDEVIDEREVTDALKGKGVVGGSLLTRGALKKCAEVGVTAFRDRRLPLSRRQGGPRLRRRASPSPATRSWHHAGGDRGLRQDRDARARPTTCCARTRARSRRPTGHADPRRRHPAEVHHPLTAAQIVETAEAIDLGLDVGAPVRGIRAPYFGRIGKVTAMPHELMKMRRRPRSRARGRVRDTTSASCVRAPTSRPSSGGSTW